MPIDLNKTMLVVNESEQRMSGSESYRFIYVNGYKLKLDCIVEKSPECSESLPQSCCKIGNADLHQLYHLYLLLICCI